MTLKLTEWWLDVNNKSLNSEFIHNFVDNMWIYRGVLTDYCESMRN